MSTEKITLYRDQFNAHEVNGSISQYRTAQAVMVSLGKEVSEEEVQGMAREVGLAEIGRVNFDEFCQLMAIKMERNTIKAEIISTIR